MNVAVKEGDAINPGERSPRAKPSPRIPYADLPDTNFGFHTGVGNSNSNANRTANHSHQSNELNSPLGRLSYIVNSSDAVAALSANASINHSTRSTLNASYDMIDSADILDDADADASSSLLSPLSAGHRKGSQIRSEFSPARPPATAQSPSEPPISIVRVASGLSVALRHPTPTLDRQRLQGAFTGNIEQLEKTAERLSMTSSIDDAIRELHDEQKRSDGRRTSLLSSPGMHTISRQISNASSIVEVNSAARSGGFSPAGFMISPRGSLTTGTRARSASKSSRFGSRPEPDLEGRPLDSFVNMSFSNFSMTSPDPNGSRSMAEHDENSNTLTRPVADEVGGHMGDTAPARPVGDSDPPTTSASMNTLEQAEIWQDFDGTHTASVPEEVFWSEHLSREPTTLLPPQRMLNFEDAPQNSRRRASQHGSILGSVYGSAHGSVHSDDNAQRRLSVGNRMSSATMGRPQSYADPTTGQEMVYYPAPVPMMLNLPQRLSKAPSSVVRNKKRSQVLSSIPAAARQSAIWLTDVLENEEDRDKAADAELEGKEYMAQHQRASMGGRRLTQDLAHMPAQLRASTFFDLPGPNQIVELKDQSAVATLDSILDASAHAPVSAFTDHAFAGTLGAEVYGRTHTRAARSTSQLMETQKKRTSSFNILRGKRATTSDIDMQRMRASTMDGAIKDAIETPADDEEHGDRATDTTPLNHSDAGDHSREASGDFGPDGEAKDSGEQPDDEGQRDDEIYHGPPTTLLAELQIRKQQQKLRTRPVAKAFPNGMHSTLLEMDAVAQVEQRSRKQKRINLAWEDPAMQAQENAEGSDEDVPLAILYAKKSRDVNRPMGLMERRDMEDNEPLSQRRNRLQGRPPAAPRAATMMNLPGLAPPSEEGETLADRVRRLKGSGNEGALPAARPVSGDFASEMLVQLGGDAPSPKDRGKGKEISTSPPPDEEETLGQRRKRLQAEREARAKGVDTSGETHPQRPDMKKRRSMADILQAHPTPGANRVATYQKPVGGLLGMHEKNAARRSSTMLNLSSPNLLAPQMQPQRVSSGGHRASPLQHFQQPHQQLQQQQQVPYNMNMNMNMYNPNPLFPQPTLGFNPAPTAFGTQIISPFGNPYAMQMGMPLQMGFNPNLAMGPGMAPLNQGQLDMVERWRQQVMQ
ncbi:hypothetical protein PZA11_001031 [Diplocarpon coronariae]|nr:hypothetical protein JHW43_002331 [Diplocarpon mali]